MRQDRVAAHRLAEHPLTEQVPDLFRWLEDSTPAETQEWVRTQNQAARAHQRGDLVPDHSSYLYLHFDEDPDAGALGSAV